MTVERHYSISTLADLLDMSERTILRAIGRGELRAKRYLREYRVSESAVNDWLVDVSPPRNGRLVSITHGSRRMMGAS